MRSLLLHAPDEDATQMVAASLGPLLPAGLRLGLSGTLGAGKTTFARAVARSLGVNEAVTSPTFVLLREYALEEGVSVGAGEAADAASPSSGGPCRLLHLDLYRLSAAEIPELMADVADALEAGAVALIEWPERAGDDLDVDDLRVRLMHAPPGGRAVEVSAHGSLSPSEADSAGRPSGLDEAEPRWIELLARDAQAEAVLRALSARLV